MLHRLAARALLNDLEEKTSRYHSNGQLRPGLTQDFIQHEILNLSMKWSIVSSMTSLVCASQESRVTHSSMEICSQSQAQAQAQSQQQAPIQDRRVDRGRDRDREKDSDRRADYRPRYRDRSRSRSPVKTWAPRDRSRSPVRWEKTKAPIGRDDRRDRDRRSRSPRRDRDRRSRSRSPPVRRDRDRRRDRRSRSPRRDTYLRDISEPRITSAKDLFNSIVSSQNFDGSWNSSGNILTSLNAQNNAEINKKRSEIGNEILFATLLALGCLELYCSSFSWNAIATKTLKWIVAKYGKSESEWSGIAASIASSINVNF